MARMRFVVLVLAGVMALSVFTYEAAADTDGREFFFYSGEGKTSLTLSKELVVVAFIEEISDSMGIELVSQDQAVVGFHRKMTYPPPCFCFLLALKEGLSEDEVLETLSRLEQNDWVKYANPVFGEEGVDMNVLIDEISVRFKEGVTRKEVEALIAKWKGVEIIKEEGWYNIYLLRVNEKEAGKDALEVANAYHVNPLVEWASPNFLATFTSDDTTEVEGNKAEDTGTDRIPGGYHLYQNVPNPFNAQTKIQYQIPMDSQVRLSIYNMKGQLINVLIEGYERRGAYGAYWDGKDSKGKEVGSGVYLCRLQVGGFVSLRKMLLLH